VIITPPVYPPFFELVPEAGGRVIEVPLAGELDIDGIERALAAGARAVLISNPHNPTGLVHSAERLAELAEVAASYDATVVSDEIHAPLVHGAVGFTPFLSVSDAARRVGVTVTSASKGFNIAGTKCALMIAEDRVPLLDAMPQEVTFRTSILGLHASIAAFEEGEAWLAETVAEIEASAARLDRLLGSLPGVTWTPPSASYLAWLHFPPEWGEDPAARAFEAGVALASGPDFGNQGAGYARLNFACSAEVLELAIERLARA
jgi:cystathionine beta-lyase